MSDIKYNVGDIVFIARNTPEKLVIEEIKVSKSGIYYTTSKGNGTTYNHQDNVFDNLTDCIKAIKEKNINRVKKENEKLDDYLTGKKTFDDEKIEKWKENYFGRKQNE